MQAPDFGAGMSPVLSNCKLSRHPSDGELSGARRTIELDGGCGSGLLIPDMRDGGGYPSFLSQCAYAC
jgi:hypothetical protein